MEDTRQCCNPFPCPYIKKDKTCEQCNCYHDDYWDENEKQAQIRICERASLIIKNDKVTRHLVTDAPTIIEADKE